MQEAVSDILVVRAREADGMSRMLAVSLAAHLTLIAGFVLAPAEWRSGRTPTQPSLMQISLGGSAGVDSGGMTPLAGRPVQAVTEEKPSPIATPAAPKPEMIESTAKPTPRPPTKPVEKPADSKSRKPTAGKEIKSGAANVDTPGAVAVPFGGLSTSSAGDGQAYTDYANFCCPAYLQTLVQLIRRNWNQNQGSSGMVLMKFAILRDGRIVDIEHEKASGQFLLDQEAKRALSKTILPPLPREFPEERLTVHLYFNYRR